MMSSETLPESRTSAPGGRPSTRAGWPWRWPTSAGSTPRTSFARSIASDVSLFLLKCQDYVNGWRRGVYPWSSSCRLRQSGPASWEQQLVLPSGWMKRYPRLGMRPLSGTIRRWWKSQPAQRRRGLVMSYPHYLYACQQLRPDVAIYYNIDDYTLYWPEAAEQVRELERAAVLAADLTVCVSRLRADELIAAIPEAAGRIHHVPHGTPTPFLAHEPLARPAQPPADLVGLRRPYLGYVGSLEDRVDWELLGRLSQEFPDASIVVVGRVREPVDEPWWEACSRFLSRPNVHALGWRPQEEIAQLLPGFRRLSRFRTGSIIRSTAFATRRRSWTRWDQDARSWRPRCRSAACTLHGLTSSKATTSSSPPCEKSWPASPMTAVRGCGTRLPCANTCHGMAERILGSDRRGARLEAVCSPAS